MGKGGMTGARRTVPPCDATGLKCPRCRRVVSTENNLLPGFRGAPANILLCGFCSALLRVALTELTESEWRRLDAGNRRAIRNARHMASEGRRFNHPGQAVRPRAG